jgi:hypothetical protein
MLRFINPSSSNDQAGKFVRFWGHDGAFEIPFSITHEALNRVRPVPAGDEAGYLAVFGTNRARIYDAATRVYARGRRGSYVVEASEF